MHSILWKASTRVELHYLDVWVAMHWDDEASTQKLVSTNFYNYASFVLSMLNSLFCIIDMGSVTH
jgi:hypothetical protein